MNERKIDEVLISCSINQEFEESKQIALDISKIEDYKNFIRTLENVLKIENQNNIFKIIFEDGGDIYLIDDDQSFLDKKQRIQSLGLSKTTKKMSFMINIFEPPVVNDYENISSLGSISNTESIYLQSSEQSGSQSQQSNISQRNGRVGINNVKEESRKFFSEIKQFLKCNKCKKYLFGPVCCSKCKEIFCISCFTSINCCPASFCSSKTYDNADSIKDDIKSILYEVKIDCENGCKTEGLTMLNYWDHYKTCKVDEKIVIGNNYYIKLNNFRHSKYVK